MIHSFILLSSHFYTRKLWFWYGYSMPTSDAFTFWYISGFIYPNDGRPKHLNTDRQPVKYLVKMKDLGITHALIFFSNPFLTNYLFSRFHYSNVFFWIWLLRCHGSKGRGGWRGARQGSVDGVAEFLFVEEKSLWCQIFCLQQSAPHRFRQGFSSHFTSHTQTHAGSVVRMYTEVRASFVKG